jgi:sugar phosphate isomerase/epimerase
MTRREWIAAASAAAATSLGAAAPQPVLGALLTAAASLLKRDPEATLKAIAEIGYRVVEGFDRARMVALAPLLKAHGLTLRSCPIETPLITADWEAYPELKQVALDEAIDSLKNAGADYCTLGYISPGARGDGDDFFRRAADRMNVVAERCRRAGMRFAWQNHAFEFAGRAGLRPIDIYKERLDPKLVGLELDVFWASAAGQNPLDLFKEWKGRVWLVRLADKAPGTPRTASENIGDGAFADLGSGSIDFAPVLKAAPAAGCRYYFAGPERAADPIESLRKSFTYLKSRLSNWLSN